jgi:methylmalonyl-CoA/ethylmalonyl-CoA epimerase
MRTFEIIPTKDRNNSYMLKIEHIGIAVKSLAESNLVFQKLLGVEPYKQEIVPSEGVKTSFFQIGSTKIELLEGITEESPIKRFLEKRSQGVHHLAFEVADIFEEVERLKEEGFEILNDVPKKGADNKMVVFLHPRSTNGVLVELCQEISG